MFSSRNIHFAVLGIILGATFGYILAFYQVQASMPAPAARSTNSGVPNGHPNVTNEQLLSMFQEALKKKPNDTQLLTKYANFLFDVAKYSEAVAAFQKVVALQPDNLDVRTDLGTALWNAGEKDKAMAEYRSILKADPKHMSTLHNLVIVHFDERDFASAERVIKQMAEIDPKYEGLEPLRKRLEELKGSK